ncbi:hypothetical protein CUMW_149350 [Citrus unshiu]|nr:hypothetical protein CUMW_149350 [Citrus unshiu]
MNALDSSIPSSFGNMNFFQILDLNVFNISMNALDSSIPSSFGNMNFLHTLDLSNNQLTGEIPEHLAVGCVNLESLVLSNNRLEGHMFSRNFHLTDLKWLQLEGNQFTGEIPQGLSKSSFLKGLYLNDNNLSGKIPRWLEKQKHEAFKFTTKNIAYTYQGKVHSRLSGLDLSYNKLVGHIPPQIGNLTRIQTLNLSHNNLTGTIPPTFSNLKHIESLDLSYNKLSGKIPHQLVELNALVVLSVAYNNLSGKIPEWTAQFATFNKSSYEGNPFLCGLPLPICRSLATMLEASTSNEGDDNLIDMDSFFITFTTSYTILFRQDFVIEINK